MKFAFPFPTLQHLASLRVAVHMANAKIGPYRSFPEAVWDRRSPVRKQAVKLEMIIKKLKISDPLKPSLMVVVIGVFQQLCQWLTRLGWCMDGTRLKERFVAHYRQMELVFDVHGRLDVTAIWERFFGPKMATTSKMEPLLELMEVAVFHQQLNHLDAILRKVMDIWDRRTELEGPNYTYSVAGKFRIRYVLKEPLSQSMSQVLCSKFHLHTDSVFVDDDSITITIFDSWMSVQCFQTYRRTAGETFSCRDVSYLASRQSANSTREALESISETEFNEQLKTMKPLQRLLEDFVLWPFAEFVFLPLMQHLHNNLLISDYLVLFTAIVEIMPSKVEFGAYYSDVFLEFWDMIGAGMKRSLYHNLLEVNWTGLMNLKTKNLSLHEMVVHEIQVLMEEDNDMVELVE